MGYFETVAEGAFKTTPSGNRVFFPFGVFARGRVLPDEQAERTIRRVMKCFYGLGWALMPLLIFSRLDWPSICGGAAGMCAIFYAVIYAKVRTLPLADERLGWGEAYRQMARNMGRWKCWGLFLMCMVLTALAVLAAVTMEGGRSAIWPVLAFAAGMLLVAVFAGWLAGMAGDAGWLRDRQGVRLFVRTPAQLLVHMMSVEPIKSQRDMLCRVLAVAVFLALPSGAGAGNWADESDATDFAEARAICREFRDVTPPKEDRPDAATAAALKGCDAEALYYGIGQPADPVAARACSFAQEHGSPFMGDGLLMTIYANGVGAERNLPVAIALACSLGEEVVETDRRVRRLKAMLDSDWRGDDFSWCFDAITKFSSEKCILHNHRLKTAEYKATMARLARRWSGGPAERDFTRLEIASDRFFETRGDFEVDTRGSAGAWFGWAELHERRAEFLTDLKAVADGDSPWADHNGSPDPDARLNRVYREIRQRPAEELWLDSGVGFSGVRKTQRAWLKYRDIWVDFVAATRPEVPRQVVINWLTLRRLGQLNEMQKE